MAPGSDRLHHPDAGFSSEPSVAPPPTPYPTAGPASGPQPGPDASQASSASDPTSTSGQGQVNRSGESQEASTGASSHQLQGDSPKARWSQVRTSTLAMAVGQSFEMLLFANQTCIVILGSCRALRRFSGSSCLTVCC